MGAGRLIHAITVSKPGNSFWDEVYIKAQKQETAQPFNILITYFYVDRMEKNNISKQVKLMEQHRKILCPDGFILLDSGVFTFKNKTGTRAHKTFTPFEREQIIEKAKVFYPDFRDYVDKYAEFLRLSDGYWDYAIDFDADPFLGAEMADMLHDRLLERSKIDRSKLARVHHVARPEVLSWWNELCHDDRFRMVGIEAGGQHGSNPDYFKPLVDIAHDGGKRTHILGIASPKFLRAVPVDTVDSTSHLVGGKFGTVFTPYGNVSFSRKGIDGPSHYTKLPEERKDYLSKYWLDKYGLTVEQLFESPYNRNIINICHMNEYWDVPYVETPGEMELFGFDDQWYV